MRILLQRVTQASVTVDGKIIGQIGRGYVLFVGMMEGDREEQAMWLAEKIVKLRLFEGSGDKINDKSLIDIGGGVLVVSQFTLAGNTEKGNRPDYTAAARPAIARPLYEFFIEALRNAGVAEIAMGSFGAAMEVALTNDGPVTVLLERAEKGEK